MTASDSTTGSRPEPASHRESTSTAGESLAADGCRGMGPRAGSRLDRAGIVWSSLCAVHCAAPLAIGFAALFSGAHEHAGHALHGHEEHGGALQLAFMLTSVIVAGLLLGRSYLRRHRDARPLAAFGLAVALLSLGWSAPWDDGLLAMTATTAGLLALVAAQVVNVVVLRRHGGCCGPTTERAGCCGSG